MLFQCKFKCLNNSKWIQEICMYQLRLKGNLINLNNHLDVIISITPIIAKTNGKLKMLNS